MPQIEQKVCCATAVLNRYVVSTSLPLSNSKRSGGTIRCKNPFLLQIEQLHSVTCDRSAVTRKRTRPQWQLPNIVSGIEVASFSRNRAIHPARVARTDSPMDRS